VFNGRDLSLMQSFFAYRRPLPGAYVFVAAGDINGDGKADIITGSDSGAAAHVKVFDGVTDERDPKLPTVRIVQRRESGLPQEM
jgi:hypothetical protein